MDQSAATPDEGAKNPYGAVDSNMPAHYERTLGPVFFADFADDLARRAAASSLVKVLEIACGTGIVTRRLRDVLAPGSELTATDLNPQMLEIARGKFTVGEPVTFRTADAMDLPFPDATFDAVVCQFGLMFFPDREKAYREVHRVLASGGRYLFSVWDSPEHNPISRLASEVAARFSPADPPRFFDMPYSYHRIDPIKESLTAAGFGDVRIAVLTIGKTIADGEAFARGLVFGSPMNDQLRARGIADPGPVIAAMADRLGQAFGTNPMRMPLQAIVYEARKH